MIKVAVVGYGLSATVFHLPFLLHSEQYQIVAVSSSQRDAVLEQYPEVEVYGDAQSMIEQCDAQLVVITAPNVVHHDLARTALEVGKHVVLEKPMTVTSEQALELSRLAEQEKLILSVYHNRRWDGDFLTIQQLINSGELGQIKVFNSNFDRFRPQIRDRWRELPGAGTGVLYDLGSHLIDQTLCLFGDPQAVT
ncbi:MAG: Gfo/Idh/MocA family oxidoreductase, partial [Pseudomonadales bacterium]